MRFILVALRRLARDRGKWKAAAPITVVAATLAAAFMSFSALTLDPQQALDRDLGGYGATVGFATEPIAPGSDRLDAIASEVRSASPTAISTLSIVGARWGGESLTVREADWSRNPLPARYVLTSGRWPRAPHEAAVTAETGLATGSRLQLLGGALDGEVVGVVEDRFSQAGSTVLLGPGAWSTAAPETASRFPAVSAYPVVFWPGEAERRVVTSFARAITLSDDVSAASVRTLVESSLVRAPDVIHANAQPFGDGNPFAYAIPAAVAGGIGVLVSTWMIQPSLRRNRRLLLSGGCGPRVADALPWASAGGVFIVGSLIGTVLGFGVGLGLRPVLASLHDQPLSPAVIPIDPALKVVGTVVLLVAGAWWFTRRRGNATRPARASQISRWVGTLAAAAALLMLSRSTTPSTAMVLSGLVILAGTAWLPDVGRWLIRQMPSHSLAGVLRRRTLGRGDTGWGAAALTSALVGGSIAFGVLLSTMVATMDGRQIPDVLPGQALVADRASPVLPVPPSIQRRLESSTVWSDRSAVQLGFAGRGVEEEAGSLRVSLEGAEGYLMLVDDVADARRLLGDEADEGALRALREGDVVRWHEIGVPPRSGGTATIEVSDGAQHRLGVIDRARPRVGWAQGKAGLALMQVASTRDLPIMRGAVLISPISDERTGTLRSWVSEAGLDEDTVVGYQEPPTPLPRLALLLTAVLWLTMTLLVVMSGAASRAAGLRSIAGQLIAQGVPASWARRHVMVQEAGLTALGAAAGLVTGLVSILVSVPRFSGLWIVSVPWTGIAGLLAATVAGAAVAAWVTATRLTPVARV